MSRSPDRRSSLESEAAPRRNHGHAVANPRMRACSTGVFGSCLRLCAPPSLPLPPRRKQIIASEPLKANMREKSQIAEGEVVEGVVAKISRLASKSQH